MPRISDERRAQQRRRIVDAAVAVLIRKGLGGMSMGEVIAESGLSAGAIYGYFSGKDELVLAVGQTVLGSRGQLLAEYAAERPVPAPAEVLRRFLGALPSELIESGAVLQLWGEAGQRPELREKAVEILDALQDAMRRYLEAWLVHGEGREAAEAETAARAAAPAVLSLVQGYVAQSTLRGRADPDAYMAGVLSAASALSRG